MRKIGSVYLLFEILVLLFGIIDYNWIKKDNSIVLKYIGELVTAFSCIGILLGIILLISWISKRIEPKYFTRQIFFIVLGIVLPFIILYSMISQLH